MVAATARELGRLDILLDYAGISDVRSFLDLDPGIWKRIIAANLTGIFLSARRPRGRCSGREATGASIDLTWELAEVARPERAAYIPSINGQLWGQSRFCGGKAQRFAVGADASHRIQRTTRYRRRRQCVELTATRLAELDLPLDWTE